MDVAVETSEKEAPVLQFNDFGLALHFAAEWQEDQFHELTSSGIAGEPMESYERDLLLYAHRDEPPFRTRLASVPAATATLTARFPPEIVYESEVRRIRLQCAAAGKAGRGRKFTVFASKTIFERSRIAVLNLVLRPHRDTRGGSELNEYDVIKLVKLWEGGEGRLASDWDEEILFEMADGEPTRLEDAARQIFPGWLPRRATKADIAQRSRMRLRRTGNEPLEAAPPLVHRAGTVELKLPRTEWRQQLFDDIAAMKDGAEAPDQRTQPARWDRLVAVGGVLQGLLDFRAISSDELADVFAEVDIASDDETLVGFHKGTLLSLSAQGEPDLDDVERRSPIGVDPYLAIPNVVLLHNEQRLKAARSLERRLSRGQPPPTGPWTDRVDINQTANGLDVLRALLAQHLPNIFHYRAERRLYETGGHSRGFDDLETLIRLRREELASTLQRRERRRDRWTAILARNNCEHLSTWAQLGASLSFEFESVVLPRTQAHRAVSATLGRQLRLVGSAVPDDLLLDGWDDAYPIDLARAYYDRRTRLPRAAARRARRPRRQRRHGGGAALRPRRPRQHRPRGRRARRADRLRPRRRQCDRQWPTSRTDPPPIATIGGVDAAPCGAWLLPDGRDSMSTRSGGA